ncbi:hypothetical protein FGG08_001796 [Glutinoglossum americanum]|uniref:Protein kinase domain-containing protein n=1 Tax=Glutinoglossum americanum TaxID=1670608 RepID=A0A9P8L606_9PEZI|nr:hypothetical protein FGG08_001796 [Glutinoglossum americanum]
MTVSNELSHRNSALWSGGAVCLEDKFEVLKDIGDGSFGSVVLARVRSGGAHVARRGTIVAVKTMKKTFDSFSPCLELREVIFLRSLPVHPHLVPALDIFLDPISKKLHICMEYMDGNLYQLMKARDHKSLDGTSVKSILYQILSGLDHIHANGFFHRDIKPENILVSTSSPQDSSTTFRRYSSLVTPPSTPPSYTVKIADFGLAREIKSKLPYTTYVSTRWYRAPEVLLRAGEYSAPVDIWAIGAMAVEVATLKPLFPGGNEVDQVWRVCEIMGSPGNWYNKAGNKVGGGDWGEGIRLAQKLGFSFPRMCPHNMDTILQSPQWPASFCHFVTWCLMWDPKNRPTAAQAMSHEYFMDAVDPLRPRSSASRILGRKHSDISTKTPKDESSPTLSSKASWFRKSLIGRESSVTSVSQQNGGGPVQTQSPRPSPEYLNTPTIQTAAPKVRPFADKRATWTTGMAPSNGAPMPILPTIRPISPLSDTVTAQARVNQQNSDNRRRSAIDDKTVKKIGRQLSVASSGNHHIDIHRQQAERALSGNGGLVSPPSGHKESSSFFSFSHLRKRARRLSGRHQAPLSPNSDDIEANAGCGPWSSNRSSMVIDPPPIPNAAPGHNEFKDLDRALQNVRYSLDTSVTVSIPQHGGVGRHYQYPHSNNGALKRHHSLPQQQQQARSVDNLQAAAAVSGPISSRTRRAMQMSVHRYETPDEEEELLDEALSSAHKAASRLDQYARPENRTHRNSYVYNKETQHTPLRQSSSNLGLSNPYPTPSPSANRNSVAFDPDGVHAQSKALDISKRRSDNDHITPKWPTPPYEENEWTASVLAACR